jgi:hypothetical protein
MAQFDVFSPDGFAISREETYPTLEVAEQKLQEWVKRYEFQGYYSTSNRERITLDKLASRCKIVPIFEDWGEVLELAREGEIERENREE